jgi:hypothetical protein
MSPDPRQPAPTPEELVAYADDALDGAARRRVESWLAEHPEAAAEVADWAQLDQALRDTQAPEPVPAAWDVVLSRVAAALPPRPAVVTPRRRVWPWIAAVAGAAAVLLVLVLSRGLLFPYKPAPTPNGSPEISGTGPEDRRRAERTAHESVAVLGGLVGQRAEAEIGDAVRLSDIPLLSHDQVTLNVRPDPDMRLENWGTPMIVDPQAMKDR